MKNYKVIRGQNEEIWREVGNDLNEISYPFLYAANILAEGSEIFLSIESDPGGGFESGFQTTSLTSPVPIQFTTLSSRIEEQKDFRFALHHESFIDKVGKFFGMEDVKTGYDNFDKSMVVKTNDIETIKRIFADESVRDVFENLNGFTLHVINSDIEDQQSSLELTLDRDITNTEELKKIFTAFSKVLKALGGY